MNVAAERAVDLGGADHEPSAVDPAQNTLITGSPLQTALEQVASLLLYRRNAFRLAGLPVNATASQVRRRAQAIQTLARVGAPPPARAQLLPPPEPVDAADLDQALQALRNPTRRLVEELFWFWPDTGQGDTTATPTDPDTARDHWEQQLRRHPTGATAAGIALHNQAILAHAQALDAESDGHTMPTLWAQATRLWRDVLASDACWEHLTDRVTAVADARLTPSVVADLRQSLPEALLTINAALLVHADTDSPADQRLRRQHQRVIAGSGFPAESIDRARTKAAQPVVARLRGLCATARDAPATSGYETARTLLDQVTGPLHVLDDLLPADHPVLDGARDDIAKAAQSAVIKCYNSTNVGGPAVDILAHLGDLAGTTQVKADIVDNLTVARGNLEIAERNAASEHLVNHCWFCQDDNVVDLADWYPVRLRNRPANVTLRNIRQAKVPRCAGCRDDYSRISKTATVMKTLTVLLSAVVVVFAGANHIDNAGLVIGAIVVGGFVLAHFYTKTENRKFLRSAATFPPLVELQDDGWFIDGLGR
jgi:hypothetical protein